MSRTIPTSDPAGDHRRSRDGWNTGGSEGSGDFTISVWAKKVSVKNWGNSVVNKWNTGGSPGTNEWNLNISSIDANGSGPPSFAIESGTTRYSATYSGSTPTLGAWYHLVGMRDGTTIKIYVNGELKGTQDVGTVAVNNVGRDVLIATLASGHYSNIIVDDLAIYRRALSADEVAQLYNASCNNASLIVHTPCTVTVPDAFAAGEKVYVKIDGVQHLVAEYIGPSNTVEQCLQKVADGLTTLGLTCTNANGVITIPEWPSNWEWDTPSDVAVLNCGGKWENYRFGFQGQEKDDEIYGATGTALSFEYRIHDPRVGRFLSIDPLAGKYPFYSPYAFSGNRVIDMVELEGLEPDESGSYGGQGAKASQQDPQCACISGTENDRWVWNNDEWNSSNAAVTSSELKTIFPNGNADALRSAETSLNLSGSSYGLTSYRAISHFLGQAGQETGGFGRSSSTENLNYTHPERLAQVYPSKFSLLPTEGKALASDYINNPEKLGNFVYADRLGNGDAASGDGYLFRGRGETVQ